MERLYLDQLVRVLARSGTRRAALSLLAGSALSGVLARLGRGEVRAEAAAARRCRRNFEPCQRDGQCCSGFCFRGEVASECRCVGIGGACKRDDQCCTRRCKNGRCRCPRHTKRGADGISCRARGGLCRAGFDSCRGVAIACGERQGETVCACVRDIRGTSRCVADDNFSCTECERNSDCTAATGAGSFCVRLTGACADESECETETVCVAPCQTADNAASADGGLGTPA